VHTINTTDEDQLIPFFIFESLIARRA